MAIVSTTPHNGGLPTAAANPTSPKHRFPADFAWGTATSSYQIEGAWNVDGKGLSIWDTFSHTPGKIAGGDNGDIATDSYYRFGEDIQLVKDLGAGMYRFSVSWPRIFPNGRGEPNRKGLDYYHRVVDALLAKGIHPMCTLYHWDLPQALEDKGGWTNRETVDAFAEYASLMYKEFAGKIKHWITFNEPWCASFLSYYLGKHAPGKTDPQLAVDVGHGILVAHGKAVQAFRDARIPGQIGIAPNVTWARPYTDTQDDRLAALRPIQWSLDWFMDPIYFGEYPEHLFTWFEKKGIHPPVKSGDFDIIHRPIDFIGANYYSASVNRYNPNQNGILEFEAVDMGYERTDIDWPYDPAGFTESMHYVYERYHDPIYITENGACINDAPDAAGRVNDSRRVNYYRQHLIALHRAITQGVDIRGYMAWSLLDNFEWAEGYSKRFGLVHVDFATSRRTPKDSYHYYASVIAANGLD